MDEPYLKWTPLDWMFLAAVAVVLAIGFVVETWRRERKARAGRG